MIPVMSTDIPWSLVRSGFKKAPVFNTSVQTTSSKRGNTAVSYMPFPTWKFEVDLNYVKGGEAAKFSVLQSFIGCFMAARGRGQLFYFTDPNDNGVSDGILVNVTPGAAAPMSTVGDGVSAQFQLARRIDQGIDIIQAPVNPGTAYLPTFVNSALGGGSMSQSGVVSFTPAPPLNAVLTWQGKFRYLCRFTEDTIQDLARISATNNRDMVKEWLWSASSIAFESEFTK